MLLSRQESTLYTFNLNIFNQEFMIQGWINNGSLYSFNYPHMHPTVTDDNLEVVNWVVSFVLKNVLKTKILVNIETY